MKFIIGLSFDMYYSNVNSASRVNPNSDLLEINL